MTVQHIRLVDARIRKKPNGDPLITDEQYQTYLNVKKLKPTDLVRIVTE